ncbi:MAG: ImmA/IrrE family metallo-endopeptidase [Pyrinomonadaceae bacterium]|nr:ImmA/IrrE family metallo-endopeptidase [Pyrinomonadaceae bacterium]
MFDPDDIPPTQKGRHYELRARGLREFAGLRRDDEPLDPFALARFAKLLVASYADIEPLLSDETKAHLIGSGKDKWSGGAASQTLPDGRKLIILNPTHGKNRQNATLMEEVCHVFLGHKPSRLAIQNRDKNGDLIARDYNEAIEEEAYSTGAAALVPYTSLKRMVFEGKTINEIARHFDVSRALIEYRIKVSRLWDAYKDNIFQGG